MTALCAFKLPDNHRTDDKPFITVGEIQLFRLFSSNMERPHLFHPGGIVITDCKESVVIPMKDLYHFSKAIVAEFEGQSGKE